MDDEVFQDRNYQVTLREVAIKENSIVFLPTGSGKTYIAVLVLKHLQKSTPSYSDGGKISFVAVNSIALVDQHTKVIEQRTNLKVGRYSGEMGLDFWPKTKWFDEFDKYQVLVLTIQILVNITKQDFLDLNKVNLIVFDECHRGVSDQPMRQLCKALGTVAEQPRILGLTATLLNRNCTVSKVKDEVRNLEVTYHSKVATINGWSEVAKFSTNPLESVRTHKIHVPRQFETDILLGLEKVITILGQINLSSVDDEHRITLPNYEIYSKDVGLKRLINSVKDASCHVKELGLYGALKSIQAHVIQIERLKNGCSDSLMYQIFNFVETMYGHLMERIKREMEPCPEKDRIYRFSSDKMLELIKIFKDYDNISSEPLCALVFTKRRFTAKVIYYILADLSAQVSTFAHLKPSFLVGYNNNPYNDTRETLYLHKKNREILQAFDNQQINILCASNVLEEGVDIRTCSLVIKFDAPEEYRSYVQSKGRARNPKSFFYMMVASDKTEQFQKKHDEFREIEKTLQDLLIGKDRADVSQREKNEMYREDPLPPYYVDGPNSAQVDMVSAPSLVSQYCLSLGCDKYTTYAPELFFEKSGEKIRFAIVLPTASPLTEPIYGPYMSSQKNAKRAVALFTCKRLHQMGELDNHLLPKKNDLPPEDVNFLFTHYPDEKVELAGTNKNCQTYRKQVPAFLRGPLSTTSPSYLHIIELTPRFSRSEQINPATIYDMYTSTSCYGLLTPHQVPQICDFPIYVALGTIDVHLTVNVRPVPLTAEDIVNIRTFNLLVLHDILDCLKDFVVCDNGADAESMIFVPVNRETQTVDFRVLQEHKQVRDPGQELTREEKLNIQVTQETYLRKIVSPWYRDMGAQSIVSPRDRTKRWSLYYLVLEIDSNRTASSKFEHEPCFLERRKKPLLHTALNIENNYLVTEVTQNKSARSEFPNDSYSSYEDYYKDKYSVSVINPDQPLLFVKGIAKKGRKFIKPQGLQSKRKKEPIHFIPELVVKQEFPASLWIQANFLPTILSRLSFLFRLEEFRVKMLTEMDIPVDSPTATSPLELDEYLLKYEPHINKKPEINVLVDKPEDVNNYTTSTLNINKGYVDRMLEQEYPWKNQDEPKDIERDLNVTVLDITYYTHFVNQKLISTDRSIKNDASFRSRNQLALTYYKDYEEKPIKLIEQSDLSRGPELRLIYKAMTTAKANDIVNMERLETLGDSFLKLYSSIYIYLKFPRFNEGLATNLKGRLVSNKNLYYLAIKKNIGGIMKVDDLQVDLWLAPGLTIPELVNNRIHAAEMSLTSLYYVSVPLEEQINGILSDVTQRFIMTLNDDDDRTHQGQLRDSAPLLKCNFISDKKIADCVEALLGACFQTCGIAGGIKFIEWMGIIPKSENVCSLLNQSPVNPIINNNFNIKDIAFHLPEWQLIQTILNYEFRNLGYLLQAVTHASYSPNRITHSYEKLEFLGDAVLDFLITCHIYESCGNLDPGELTDLRSALVNNNTFSSLVVKHKLYKHLLLINGKLQGMIDRFAEYIESKNFEIDGEVLILLEEKDIEGMLLADYIDVPKVLGDVFEALAGAIYLDSGNDLKVVWRVFHRLMFKEIQKFSADVPKNLIRRIYEWTPDVHPQFGDVKEVRAGKSMVPLQFMLNGHKQVVFGFGSNKTMAKRAAAKLALRQLS